MQPEGQNRFAAALLSPEVPVPHNIVDPQGRIAPKRFAVYRNNVTVSLIEAVKASFPAVLALVGEAFLVEMARHYVRRTPPQSSLLFEYGRGFADFVAAFPSAAGLPFLADVARLDRAWLDAYHAADSVPLAPAGLAAPDAEALTVTRFIAHPAARLVPSHFPLVAIWQAARNGDRPDLGAAPQAEWGLVTRPDLDIGVVALSAAAGSFFQALLAGQALGIAAETALESDAGFDLGAALSILVGSGAFARLASPQKE